MAPLFFAEPLFQIIRRVNGNAVNCHLKVQMAFLRNFLKGCVTYGADNVAGVHLDAFFDAVWQLVAQVFVGGNGVSGVGDGNGGAHHGGLADV